MEFKERVEHHRSKLEQSVEVEKLYPLLKQEKALTPEDVIAIEAQGSRSAKVCAIFS